MAYRARVDAVYRQHDADRDHGRVKEPERETVVSATRRIEGEGRQHRLASPGGRSIGTTRLVETVDDGNASVSGGSVPVGRDERRRDSTAPDNGEHKSRVVAASDAFPVGDDDRYCPVSELKGDEPSTAERLMKTPEFTGKALRGFKGTDNPDYIDDYKRTYDAVAGPTAWADPRLNMDKMINQIRRHMYEKDGIDFTVLDLTGASGVQVDEVFKSLDEWTSSPAMSPKSKLIILGGSY